MLTVALLCLLISYHAENPTKDEVVQLVPLGPRPPLIPNTAVGDLPNFPKWLPKVPESLVQEQKGVKVEQKQVLLLQLH